MSQFKTAPKKANHRAFRPVKVNLPKKITIKTADAEYSATVVDLTGGDLLTARRMAPAKGKLTNPAKPYAAAALVGKAKYEGHVHTDSDGTLTFHYVTKTTGVAKVARKFTVV